MVYLRMRPMCWPTVLLLVVCLAMSQQQEDEDTPKQQTSVNDLELADDDDHDDDDDDKDDDHGNSGRRRQKFPILEPETTEFIFQLRAREVLCFYYMALGDFEVTFDVVKGGDLDIGMNITNSTGHLVMHGGKESNRKALLVPVANSSIGRPYAICANNRKAGLSKANKRVYLEVSMLARARAWRWLTGLEHARRRHNLTKETLASLVHVHLAELALNNIGSRAARMSSELSMFRLMDKKDKARLQGKQRQVNVWSGCFLLVMVATSFVQVVVIRSLFGDNDWGKLAKWVVEVRHRVTGSART